MPIEDRVHPFLKFYTAAPQWVKSSLGQLYALAPARLRYGAKYEEFVAEIANCADPAGGETERTGVRPVAIFKRCLEHTFPGRLLDLGITAQRTADRRLRKFKPACELLEVHA